MGATLTQQKPDLVERIRVQVTEVMNYGPCITQMSDVFSSR
jgi:hypothetical protein